MFLNIIKEEFMAPSKYLFARNYYKIKEALNFCKSEVDNWYDLVKDNDKERVVVVHNNLSLEHYIYNQNKSALISWDNYKIDTPVIDIVHLYQKEYLNYDFSAFLTKYLNNFELLDHEKKLLFILISLPIYFDFDNEDELKKVQDTKKYLSYIFTSEKLIRPYYSEKTEE